MTKRVLALFACVMVMGSGAGARGQFVDEGKGGAPQDSGRVQEWPGKVLEQRESLTRELLRLKALREETAARVGKGSAELTLIDKDIDGMRLALALESKPGADPGDARETQQMAAALTMPMFPRIVQVAPDAAGGAGTGMTTQSPSEMSASTQGIGVEQDPVRAALMESQVSVVAENMGLSKVIDSIRAQSKVNVDVNWKALESAGIDRNTLVTVNLNQVTGEQALKVVLGAAGGAVANLDFTTNDGIVIVSTRDDLNSARYQVIHVYSVNDLLAVPQGYALPPQLMSQVYENRVNNLRDIMMSVIAPESWRDNGGTVGSIRELDGRLIINQTKENHLQIERFLAQIRAMPSERN